MIKVVGEKLKQYDIGRQVEIIPTGTVLEVKFLNRSPNPFEVAFTEENGRVYADIPNVLLKTFGVITVETLEMLEDGSQIEQRMTFNVDKRQKPEGYECPADAILTKNYLKQNGGGELPFGKTITYSDTLAWDGDITDKEHMDLSDDGTEGSLVIVKLSDDIVNLSDLKNGVTFELSDGESVTVSYDDLLILDDGVSVNCGNWLWFLPQPTDSFFQMDLPAGIWTQILYNKHVTKFTIPNHQFVESEIKPIDVEYLPKSHQFGEITTKSDSITWDGDTSKVETIDPTGTGQMLLCRVSDIVPTSSDFANGAKLVFGNGHKQELTANEILPVGNGVLAEGNFNFVIVSNDNTTVTVPYGGTTLTVTFPKKGVYFGMAVGSGYTRSLTITGYTGFKTTEIKTIDPKYVPITRTIFYINRNGDDANLYLDKDYSIKPTIQEVINAYTNGEILLEEDDGNMYYPSCVYLTPVLAAVRIVESENAGAVVKTYSVMAGLD